MEDSRKEKALIPEFHREPLQAGLHEGGLKRVVLDIQLTVY